MSSTPIFTSSKSQRRWREHMKHNYTINHDIRPCVFQVPDNLKETKPEAYTPQLVGLGPYHHFRPHVQHMEREKRAVVLDVLKNIKLKDFINLPEICPEDFEPIIRSCYDRYLDLDKETLAWVLIVDGLYLWYLMGDYSYGKKQERNEALYAELFMLENQIPIVLIQESFKYIGFFLGVVQNLNEDKYEERLLSLYRDFCQLISPLKLTSDEGVSRIANDKNKHLLHYMYQMIVKTKRDNNNNNNPEENQDNDNNWVCDFVRFAEAEVDFLREYQEVGSIMDVNEQRTWGDRVRRFARAAASKGREMADRVSGFARAAASRCREMGERVSGNAREAASQVREIIMEAIEVFNSSLSDAKLAGIKVPGNVDTVSNLLRNIHSVLDLHLKRHTLGDDQFDIPSVSRLKAILKITFKPLPDCCGIGDITLDKQESILYLPVITLQPSSEIILRNLVAYEETSKMGSTQIRAYVELICGIIKSEKDVKLLRDAGIINGKLPDREIVRMCNGFKKSDEKPDEESNNNVQSTVQAVNDQFSKAGVVKACRSIMKGFAGCVKFLKPLFPVLVLLFLAFQSFCEIYGCRRRGSSYGGTALHEELDPNARLMLPRKVYHY